MSRESLYEELRLAILERPPKKGSELAGFVADFLVKRGVATFQVADFLDWLRTRTVQRPSFHSYAFVCDDSFLELWSRAAKTLFLSAETLESLGDKLTGLQVDYYRQCIDSTFSLSDCEFARAAAAGCPFAQRAASKTKRFISTPLIAHVPASFWNGHIQLGTDTTSADICLVPEGAALPSSTRTGSILLVLGRVHFGSSLPADAVIFGTSAARICADALADEDPMLLELRRLRDLTIADCQFLFQNSKKTHFVQCSDPDYILNLAVYLKVATEATIPTAFWRSFPRAPSSLEPYSDVLSASFVRDHPDFFANK